MLEIMKNSRGAFIANFQSGWQYAFLTAVHKTGDGYLGSVLYGTAPPTRQMVNQYSRVYALRVMRGGKTVFEMIPTETALQHEISSGMRVPPDAYLNAFEITFGEFIHASGLIISQSSTGLPVGECGLRYFGMLEAWITVSQATECIVPNTTWSGYQNIGDAS